MADFSAVPRGSRPRGLSGAFLVASAVAHAAAFWIVAALQSGNEPAPAPMPLLLRVQIAAQPFEIGQPSTNQPHEAVPRRPIATTSTPSLPEGQAVAEPTAGVRQPDEARAPAADGGNQGAPSVVTPPFSAAVFLDAPQPRYPQASWRAGEHGTVTLRVLVRRDGMPAQVEIEKTSGSPHLDAAAQEAVRGWRFAPARRGADAIESWMMVPVEFRLVSAS